ncbi:MAG: 3-ketoacyl-ACP reductase, partial [Tannerella sp.]|nr:3-ketoacyl-ACP reductase [Tannerella sp.]
MRKTAFITGGTRGIGLGIAMELAKADFDLAVNGVREEDAVKNVLAELSGYGVQVIYVRGDVSKKEDRARMVDVLFSRFGHINILVNNAGIAPPERKDILEASEDIFEYVLRVNLQGPYFLTQSIANRMIESKKKQPDAFFSIINVSSISAKVVSTNRGEYCISKAGIAMATQLWAARLGEYEIPVYEIQPGVIKTDMTAGVKDKYDKLFGEGLAVQQRWGTPADVGKVVAAMANGNL